MILRTVLQLVDDASTHVRLALGTCLSSLAPAIGKDLTARELLPVLLTLLRDEETDVRLAVLNSMDPVQETIGVKLLGENILPAVLSLTTDAKWRVRLGVVSALPKLAAHLASEKFTPEILDLCTKMLVDPVFNIRRATIDFLAEVIDISRRGGSADAASWVLQRLKSMSEAATYEPRLTAALALESLCKHSAAEGGILEMSTMRSQVIPTLVKLSRDPIPNVRIAVSRALGLVFGSGLASSPTATKGLDDVQASAESEDVERMMEMESVQDCLTRLCTDADADVVYFAKKALQRREAGEE
eukprot:scaffold69_cov248-Pinguiococcus_pyrenoidosus.AAC.11